MKDHVVNRMSYALCALCALALVVGIMPLAGASELDPGGAPAVVVQKLDPASGTVTSYRAPGLDEALRPSSLAALPEAERNAAVKKFIDGVAVPENKLSEVPVVRDRVPTSELDPATSTPAWGWRYRWGGWYGHRYYGSYYGYSSYYYPYYGYSSYGGYYPYYGYSYYYPYYSYGYYYPYYTVYGYGW